MTFKTNFSFDLQYDATSLTDHAERNAFMASLESSLQQLLLDAGDSAAKVTLSNSHKGNANKIVEFVSTLSDQKISEILTSFSAANGVSMSALE